VNAADLNVCVAGSETFRTAREAVRPAPR